MAGTDGRVDEDLYSRQLYVIGHDAAAKMADSDVIISGLGGLGVEIAKNVILSGVKSVTLHDTKLATKYDLTTQYFLTSEDVGQNRAIASQPRLAELNSYVHVYTNTEPLTEEFIKGFSVVVLTDSTLEEQLRLTSTCHSRSIPVLVASTRGLFGQLFCDFGENFEVLDPNGRELVVIDVANITKAKEGVVSFPDMNFHGLFDDDQVIFTGVRGMTELNHCPPRVVKMLSPTLISIGDTSKMSDYEGGGTLKQIRVSEFKSFKSLKDSILNPSFVTTDDRKTHLLPLVHVAFLALHEYVKTQGSLPRPWNEDDAQKFLEVFATVRSTCPVAVEVDEGLLRKFACTAAGELVPVNAVVGSIAAQEVLKACSGKFTPVSQWLYYDALESLPEDTSPLTPAHCAPEGGRYDAQIAVFGRDFQRKLENLKYFIVGAGAIGCELLKNFAMLGIGAGERGSLIVTDMDHIEKSNLSRQFLFRSWDVKKAKSRVAAAAVGRMNPEVHIVSHELRVGSETEHIYNSEFYSQLDGVANALDNVEARRYMDGRCWHYRKPLLESGTLGTNGSVQVVVPNITERYIVHGGSHKNAIAMCTLKNFPVNINHTLQWARDMFEGAFRQPSEVIKQYLEDPGKVQQMLRAPAPQDIEHLNSLKEAISRIPRSFTDCVKWARLQWEEQFHFQIAELLQQFPPDHRTESGAPFWTGNKRCPHPLKFDAAEEEHLTFVLAGANLLAESFGIPQERDPEAIVNRLKEVDVPEFVPRKEPKKDEGLLSLFMGSLKISDLQAAISPPEDLKGLILNPLSFEKDDDTNLHMDFVTSASNLRAENYDIEKADKYTSKRIAGRIIPAIVTSTALVAGLVAVELFKVVQGHKRLDLYKSSEFSLALPRFCSMEPEAAPVKVYNGVEWRPWDMFEVEGDMTLEEFFKFFKEKHELSINMVAEGDQAVFSFFLNAKEKERRMKMTITAILKELVGEEAAPKAGSFLMLDLNVKDREGKRVEVPFVRYSIPATTPCTN
ncbi:ubiquitin-like modifier-activating enzyme 1 [Penaeus indicus]|uniref:ubiquitin-like modifier-activating enzyme 1 n=1 Tax=Penaeus indicus TaxID=29960 RepID=UPI00300D0D7E